MILVIKGISSETTVCALRTKFEFSSIILTGFRQGVILTPPSPPPPPHQNKPPKSLTRLGLIVCIKADDVLSIFDTRVYSGADFCP